MVPPSPALSVVRGHAWLRRGTNWSTAWLGKRWMVVEEAKNSKAPSGWERAHYRPFGSSHLSYIRAGVGTCPPTFNGGGCRGVIGPVPWPPWMRVRATESSVQLSFSCRKSALQVSRKIR